MILNNYELTQLTGNNELVFNEGMTVAQRGAFYYKLMTLLSKNGLYLKVINKIDNKYFYTLGYIKDIA